MTASKVKQNRSGKEARPAHPLSPLLHFEGKSTPWCSGCGIGTVVNGFTHALEGANLSRVCVVSSGAGCTGRIDEYLTLKTEKVNDGDLFEHIQKSTRRDNKGSIVVFLDDADLLASRVDGLFSDTGSKAGIVVIYVTNYLYHIYLNHRKVPFTPLPNNNLDDEVSVDPFNFPKAAQNFGASYIARWTPLHARRLQESIAKALANPGLSAIEVISHCLMYLLQLHHGFEQIDRVGFFKDNTELDPGAPTDDLGLVSGEKIIIGEFLGGEGL